MISKEKTAAYNIQDVIDAIDCLAYDGAIFEDEADEMTAKLRFAQDVLMKEDYEA